MHPLLQTVLVTVFVPAAVAAGFALVSTRVPPGRGRGAVLAWGLGAAWCAGLWLAVRAPRWPAVQASDWHFFAVAAASFAVLVTPWWRGGASRRWLAGFLFFAVFFAVMLHRYLAGLWPAPVAWLWPVGGALLAVVSAAAVGVSGRHVQAAATVAGVLFFAVLSSGALVMGGSASLAHASGILAAACGGGWVISLLLRRQVDMLPVGFVAAAICGGLLLQGVVYAQLPAWSALILALTWPAAAVVTWLARRIPGAWRVALFLVVVVVPSLAAVWLAKG